MSFGAENIASTHYLWRKFDNHFIPSEIFKSQSTGSRVGNVSYRLTKLFLLEYPLAFILPTIQHERLGHGSRVKEFGGDINEVSITFPPPFQFEAPYIRYSIPSSLTTQQGLMITVGGSESNEFLANIIRKNILLDDELDYHNAFLYLYANNDLSGYVTFAANISGSDITNYLSTINNYYGSSDLSLGKIQLYGVLSILLDPINFYSFNSIFNEYVSKGNSKSKIHLIPLVGNIRYLPKLKFGLTPYGPELMLQNYLRHSDRLYSFSISSSDGAFENFWRLGAEVWNVVLENKFSLNLSSQFWNQPNMEFYVGNQLERSEGFGGLMIGSVNYNFCVRENLLGLTLQFGYKSKGFAVGERLDSGLIVRGGLAFRIRPAGNKP